MFGLDALHVFFAVAGVAITLAYKKWGTKAPDGTIDGRKDGQPDIIIPNRPVITMLLALLHKIVDGSEPADVKPSSSGPLDLQQELLLLLHKLQLQQMDSFTIAEPVPPVVQSPPK